MGESIVRTSGCGQGCPPRRPRPLGSQGAAGSRGPAARTLEHRREYCCSSLYERATYEAWREKGGGTLADRAGDHVDQILEAAPEPLACDEELLAIIAAAEKGAAASA